MTRRWLNTGRSLRKARYLRLVMKWVGARYMVPENDFRLYANTLRDRDHATACSRWYRTFLSREFRRRLGGEFADEHVRVPVRWLHGTADPVITPTLLRELDRRVDDVNIELAPGVGHWIAEQQRTWYWRGFAFSCANPSDLEFAAGALLLPRHRDVELVLCGDEVVVAVLADVEPDPMNLTGELVPLGSVVG
jgi:pimeloyl-ACP methyl ester carboxylesterase